MNIWHLIMAIGQKLIEGIDFVMLDGKFVWTEKFLLERGFCCNGKCPYCPYKEKAVKKVK